MPKQIKMRHEQAHLAIETLEDRLELCKWYLVLTRTLHELTFPNLGSFGSNVELMLVMMGVFIGDAEGRPTTATKIANHCGMSRQAVYRRLEQLTDMKKVIREGKNYYIAPGVAPLDVDNRLPQVLEKFPATKRPIRTT
jgi:hypothetical protein